MKKNLYPLLKFINPYLRPIRIAGTGILFLAIVLGLGLYIKQQQEKTLSSFDTGIDALESQINKLPSATANSKATITQKIATLEKQINSLPETLPTKKELNRQLADLQQQIDTFPDNSIPSKDRLSLEKDRLSLEKDLATARNAIWATLFQAATAIFFALTAISTWLNFQAAKEKQITDAENARANLKATEEKQITERFSKAVELLGSDKIEVRLGGIYALERIAKDSPKDHWTIMEVLTSFIREKSPLQPEQKPRTENLGEEFEWDKQVVIFSFLLFIQSGLHRFVSLLLQNYQEFEEYINQTSQSNPPDNSLPKIATDVQAALTVIGRRNFKEDKGEIDLSSTNLSQANLREAHLEGAYLSQANLREAHLEGAYLIQAHLEGAYLIQAHLEGADLREAHLERAYLWKAHLERAYLWKAHLEGANLIEAHLERANLIQAHLERASLIQAHLKRASLIQAHLEGAYLWKAHLEGADLRGAHLEGADLWQAHLEKAKNLTVEQVKSALNWETAYYDDKFRRELGL